MLYRFFCSCCIALVLLIGGNVHAGDATSFNPVSVPVVAKSAGGVPVGTVIAWPVSKNPEDMDKWLECNGQSVSSTVYPELFALVGGTVPDYRGKSLYGKGGAAPAGEFYAWIYGSRSGYHNDGIVGVTIGPYSVSTGGTWGQTDMYSAGMVQVPFAGMVTTRYLIRALP